MQSRMGRKCFAALPKGINNVLENRRELLGSQSDWESCTPEAFQCVDKQSWHLSEGQWTVTAVTHRLTEEQMEDSSFRLFCIAANQNAAIST